MHVMGPELGALFYHLRNETISLNCKWIEYKTLFGTNETRIGLLNDAAPSFFGIVQKILWNDTVLHIARMTDEPEIKGKNTLTLRKLPEVVEIEMQPYLIEHLDAVLSKAKFVRDWRNRRLAHSDFHLNVTKTAKHLKSATRLQVDQVIKAINDLLNFINFGYCKTTTLFDGGFINGNAKDLLYVLREGLAAMEQQQKRLEEGKFFPEDDIPKPRI